ncbi:hypothetical protein [Ligilactobacillus salivarius]|uniref:Uncharacterized protein n=2 Tax=Ligilactobacillus salivarius TaxID=1624 RepID=C2EIW3_9LACO|nr:hypothetical protein [Ligilactobacillus salivarius]ATP38481.1 hypothetical protein CR531_10090 [Ligilactobacillus salivarius]EEJ73546.1 hypothetical protein HMPREF0545_1585 [Ligilactobacillus salivarius DSM 20555 = ATCC 11741]KRM68351.1 hypothetical protein FC55_GL001340 [Ligilactobacillus salivarius DSM 20555 = ATCC 11741]MBE7387244.1 hypothetical protein [Ligilactobacillus salivarius]MBE7391638.1 hypothetical protein [Ligilactobacillus salivarius]
MKLKQKINNLFSKVYEQRIRYVSVILASLLSLATVYELFTAYGFVVEMTKIAELQRHVNINQIKTPDELIRLAFHLANGLLVITALVIFLICFLWNYMWRNTSNKPRL